MTPLKESFETPRKGVQIHKLRNIVIARRNLFLSTSYKCNVLCVQGVIEKQQYQAPPKLFTEGSWILLSIAGESNQNAPATVIEFTLSRLSLPLRTAFRSRVYETKARKRIFLPSTYKSEATE